MCHTTLREKNKDKKIGIYLHWYGNPDIVSDFLYCAKKRGIRNVDSDNQYFWARFCQGICNFLSLKGENSLSVGIGIVSDLDFRNGDNGVYYVNSDFEIEKQTNGSELM